MLDITDVHMHVVPGYDDGAQNMSESLKMLEMAYSEGVRRVFCTSHSYDGEKAKSIYDRQFGVLCREAKKKLPGLELYPGCEIYIEENNAGNVIKQLDSGLLPTMNNTRFVLAEFDIDVENDEALNIAGQLTQHGYVPIIAHAERYWELSAETVRELKNIGCFIQMNMFSLTRDCDMFTRRIAEGYCKDRMVDFIGSDAHGFEYRPPVFYRGVCRLVELCGEKYTRDVCGGNAEKVFFS